MVIIAGAVSLVLAQGEPIMVCEAPRGSWSEQWPDLQHLG